MRKYQLYYTSLIGLFCATMMPSCSDDDPTPFVAIKEVRITPAENAISVSCTGTAYSSVLDNSNDSVAYDVPAEALQQATMEVETTVGPGIQAYYQNTPVEGPLTVDASQPFELEVRGYGQSRTYTVNVYQEQVNNPSEQPRLKSSNMRAMGINANTVDFDVTLFHDQFYAITTASTGGVIYYQLYTSDNGISWDEVSYTCSDAAGNPTAIGGRGARLAVVGDRMYVLGGGRYDGTDSFGNDAELSWGLPTVSNWRSFSTTDGQTFQVDTIGIGYNESNQRRIPSPTAYPTVAVFGNNIYYQGGYGGQVFGMWQTTSQFRVSSDGKNWDVAQTGDVTLTNRHMGAWYTFKGRLYVLGGFRNFISTSALLTDIYSTADGVTWTLEAESTALGAIHGVKVVTTDDVAYAFGGEYYNEAGEKTVSNKIYRSTDGVTWEKVTTVSPAYTARRSPVVVVKDGTAYIFGGYSGTSNGNYAYPTDQDTMFDTYTMELQ